MNVPVLLACDERYALPCSVTIRSLFTTRAQDTTYEAYVLAGNLSDDACRRLSSMSTPMSRVTIVPCGHLMQAPEYHSLVSGHAYLTAAAFFRFHAAELLSGLEKAIYLDSDIIVRNDLSGLFGTTLGGTYAGVVQALSVLDLSRGTRNPIADPYFNSGVMLLDLSRMRREQLGARLRQETARQRFPCHDQDALNYVFAGNVTWLSPTYNYCTTYDILCSAREAAGRFGITPDEWRAIQNDPAVVHYIHDKPWIYRHAIRGSLWHNWFSQSPYRDTPLDLHSSLRVSLAQACARIVPKAAWRPLRNAYVRVRYGA